MKAKIIFYTQKDLKPRDRTKFKKEFSGHNDSSHGGRYKYKIEGLLDKIKYIKPCHGAIIVNIKDAKKIIEIIAKYNIKYTQYGTELTKKDFEN